MMNAIELSVKSGDETLAFGIYVTVYRLLGTIPGSKISGKYSVNLIVFNLTFLLYYYHLWLYL